MIQSPAEWSYSSFFFFSYAATAKITSDRYRDQLKTPLQTAIHWVKHVAKNKGAPHLRSAAVDLPFYVYYNLDVYAASIAIVTLVPLVALRIFKTIIRSVSGYDGIVNSKQKFN